MSKAPTHAVFHDLVVSGIERLTDDSVAVTFAVPDELLDDYAFGQGQHLTLKWGPAEDQVRRNYRSARQSAERYGSGSRRFPTVRSRRTHWRR